MVDHLDFRDIVHTTQAQMLKKFGDNIFQGRVIEVHIGTLLPIRHLLLLTGLLK